MDIKQALLNLPASRLKKVIRLKEKIETLGQKLEDLLQGESPRREPATERPRRRMSAAGRAKIAKAARARWAKWRAERK